VAIIFFDSFDHYNAADIGSKWSAIQSLGDLSMVTGRFGGQALKINAVSNAASLTKNVSPITNFVMGLAYYRSSFTFENIPFSFYSGSSEQVSVNLGSDGTLNFYYNGSPLTVTNASAYSPLTLNRWNFIEILINCSTSVGANSCKIFVNNNLYQTLNTGQNIDHAGTGTINNITTRNTYPNQSQNYIDDFYLLTIDADTTGPLGDSRVEAIYPTGAGSNTDWTPDSGSNYARVNEVHADGDTSYVSSNTLDQVDTYAFGGLSSTPSAIYGVQACLWNRKDATSVRQIEPTAFVGGTAYSQLPSTSMSTSYSCYTAIFRFNPATLAVWTESDINGAEFGFTLST